MSNGTPDGPSHSTGPFRGAILGRPYSSSIATMTRL